MRYNRYHEPVYDESDLPDLLLTGADGFFSPPIMEHPVCWPDELELDPFDHVVNSEEIGVNEYDRKCQNQWWIPEEYEQIDVAALVLSRCNGEAEIQRAAHELLMYAERGMIPLLNYMHYLVDTMTKHNIVWGVGRGSSTASFVLYLLGVHRINSLHYDLDIGEFLK